MRTIVRRTANEATRGLQTGAAILINEHFTGIYTHRNLLAIGASVVSDLIEVRSRKRILAEVRLKTEAYFFATPTPQRIPIMGKIE